MLEDEKTLSIVFDIQVRFRAGVGKLFVRRATFEKMLQTRNSSVSVP